MIDYIILGAQKAGTTTMYRHLVDHPGLTSASVKEFPAMHELELSPDALQAELAKLFGERPVSGQLIVDPRFLSSETAMHNAVRLTPNAKTAVLLRDPLERARSQHTMMLRRRQETRSLVAAITDEVTHLSSGNSPADGGTNAYLSRGLYGHWLGRWVDAGFEPVLLDFGELAVEPQSVVDDLCARWNIDSTRITAPLVANSAHVVRQRSKLEAEVRRVAPVRWLWRQVPRRLRHRTLLALDGHLRDGSAAAEPDRLEPDTRQVLLERCGELLSDDWQVMRERFGHEVPVSWQRP